ncbi:formate dehydrogenase accessory protein FdhE [Nonomuraea polychroma]|uniref:formate dehydrogenase accessory protein FdhE domain-containing protein n=1 Tax=Nonomuraea polychroma TaxID=46176 RepID=UPI003D8E2F25
MFARDRARAGELRERYPHAAEVFGLYLALVEAWESVGDRVPSDGAVEWAHVHVLPRVIEATAAHGPPLLAAAVRIAVGNGLLAPDARAGPPAAANGPLGTAASSGGSPLGTARDSAGGLLAAWLAGEELAPVERYLARATMRVVPLATPPVREAAGAGPVQGDPRPEPGRCPACGGAPQLSYRTAGDDPLVSGRRMLHCARCAHEWSFSATTCPQCGETGKRTVHAEAAEEPPRQEPRVGRGSAADDALFPHLRAESCETCRGYLIDVDLGRDPRAVPHVDELAAIPIDLHMADHGYIKITPNLMGF